MTLFGPAGNSDSFTRQFKASVSAPAWLRERGLGCYEYQCGRGVHLGEDTARAIGSAAADNGIRMSLHAPYFINLSGGAPERVEKNLDYILQAARACGFMGGDRIVVHCGGLSGMTREEAFANTARCLALATAMLEEQGPANVRICLETMGKQSVLGDAAEVFALCAQNARLIPCVDFGHLNARTQGGMRAPADVAALFDALESAVGLERAREMHIHFSHIEYGRGGEVRHLTFAETAFGPDFAPVARELAARGYAARVICESAGTQAEDALTMQREYLESMENLK